MSKTNTDIEVAEIDHFGCEADIAEVAVLGLNDIDILAIPVILFIP
jgi:hypothetical protein